MGKLCRLSLSSFLFATAVFGQRIQSIPWAAVPADPNEPVRGGVRVLTNPQERSAALQLLDRARQNYTFYGPQAPPFSMKVSFTSSGQSQYEGQGSMQETWTGPVNRWNSKFAGVETVRVLHGGQVWSDNPSAPVPMRVQMARDVLLWPVMNPMNRAMLRSATTTINGSTAECILISGGVPDLTQPRHWFETEYCVNPESGNLLIWSEAPRHFVIYDYSSSTEFQGHLVANDISIYEAGNRVMQIHVDGIQDASTVKPESLLPVAKAMSGPSSFALGGPQRFPLMVPAGQVAVDRIQPVIVHATLDLEGHVIEAETLDNSNPELAAKAIEVVKNQQQGPSGVQREVFVNVEFQMGSTPVAAAH